MKDILNSSMLIWNVSSILADILGDNIKKA